MSSDLFTQQAQNRRRSMWLVAGFVAFFAWLGFGGDYIAWMYTSEAEEGLYRHAFPWLGVVLSTFAIGTAGYAWSFGPKRVLWSTGAREIVHPRGEQEQQLVNVVEEMSIASGLPRPGIWIIEDDDPNAFATGRDTHSSHVAVTRGLLALLDRDELQAVIGHEMGHISNLDVRLMTLLAAMVGAVALMSDGVWRIMRGTTRITMSGGSRRGSKKSGGNPVMLLLLILWLLSWLLAPIVTRLLALGVSRKREYLADAMSAQFTRNPLSLASALHKIEHAAAPTRSIKRGSAHLCIADPLGRRANLREGFLSGLFGTHPPMALRVARLKAMGYAQQKRGGTPTEPLVAS